jgi:uncharacterized protein YsxB (DUF464 family)
LIRVRYRAEDCFLEITGHAGSAPRGQDLICAGVSALALTLAENVERLGRLGWLAEQEVSLVPGDTRIRCRPKEEYAGTVQVVFAAVCAGFEVMEERWPGFVELGVLGHVPAET